MKPFDGRYYLKYVLPTIKLNPGTFTVWDTGQLDAVVAVNDVTSKRLTIQYRIDKPYPIADGGNTYELRPSDYGGLLAPRSVLVLTGVPEGVF